jgi:hypothetical protein
MRFARVEAALQQGLFPAAMCFVCPPLMHAHPGGVPPPGPFNLPMPGNLILFSTCSTPPFFFSWQHNAK